MFRSSLTLKESEHLIQSDQSIFKAELETWTKLRITGTALVDKSLLIHSIINQPQATIITRPRRWGKTINLKMLQTFFNMPLKKDGSPDDVQKHINLHLFLGYESLQTFKANLDHKFHEQLKKSPEYIQLLRTSPKLRPLKISKHLQIWKESQPHFANHIVLQLSFISELDDVQMTNEMFLVCLKRHIRKLYQDHIYLASSDSYFMRLFSILNQDIYEGCHRNPPSRYMIYLIQALYHFHRKQIIILVDQYDNFYSQASLQPSVKQQELSKILKTLIGFLTLLVKGQQKDNIKRVIITGVRAITQVNDSSGYSFWYQTPFNSIITTQFYGFTKQQIEEELIQKLFSHISSDSKKDLMELIEKYYNGFRFKGIHSQINVYNPYSVSLFLRACKRQNKFTTYSQKDIQTSINEAPIIPCFWVEQQFNIRIIKTYLKILKSENIQFIYYLFQILLNNFDKDSVNHKQIVVIPKNYRGIQYGWKKPKISQFNQNEFLYLLVGTGYLTIENNQIKIPNEELRIFFQKIFLQYLQEKLKIILDQDFKDQLKQCKLGEWDSFQHVLKKSLNKFLLIFMNFCEPLFSALMLTEFMAIGSGQKYMILYEKRMSNIQPDIMFFSHELQTVIIQQNKVLYGLLNVPNMFEKSEEAIFQIFKKNYFRILDRINKPIKKVIVRGVVGHYVLGKSMTLHSVSHQFSYENILKLTELSETIFKLTPHANKLQDIILMRFDQQESKHFQPFTIKEIAQMQKQFLSGTKGKKKRENKRHKLFSRTLQFLISFCNGRLDRNILKRNVLILDNLQSQWERHLEGYKQKMKIGKRIGEPIKYIMERYQFVAIQRAILLRFHGFLSLEQTRISEQDIKYLIINERKQQIQVQQATHILEWIEDHICQAIQSLQAESQQQSII